MPERTVPGPRYWIGTGWKMNKTLAEARAYADALTAPGATADPAIQRFVVPPFTLLREVAARLDGSGVLVGAQNMHWEDRGAWTGEISAPMLADCGVGLVEIGHSERRTHFGETDETVGLKVAAAHRHGLTALVCIGERRDETDRADAVLARQVRAAQAHVPPDAAVVFAYEPVWAIGDGGSPADPEWAEDRHKGIKATAAELTGAAPRCLYGGSVDAGNCTAFLAQPSVDGLFIGRAAWQVEGYLDILARCRAAI